MVDSAVDISGLANMEDQLAAVISRAASEVGHIDTLDDEVRSEIYTIIQAIRSDTQQHRQIVGQWISEASNA